MLYSCMNNTKWNEIRAAMIRMEYPPLWKITFLNGYESAVDGEWFYHFSEGGYLDIQYLDILTNSVAQHAAVGTILRAIHLPGIESQTGFRILGYADALSNVDYLQLKRQCARPKGVGDIDVRSSLKADLAAPKAARFVSGADFANIGIS